MKAVYAVAFAAVFVAYILGVKAVKCPPQNDADVTLIPDPKGCKTFYICNEGIPYLMTCPDGLHFNPKIRVCDLPEHAQCVSGGSTPPVPEQSTPVGNTEEPAIVTTTEKSATVPTTEEPTTPPNNGETTSTDVPYEPTTKLVEPAIGSDSQAGYV